MRNQNSSSSMPPPSDAAVDSDNNIKSQDSGERIKPLLRKMLVSKMAIGMMLVATILLPLSILVAVQGEYIPLLLIGLVFGVSAYSITSSHSGRNNYTMSVELVGLLLGGSILSFADPNFLDPGMAIIFLAPVHLALVRGRVTGANIWIIFISLSAVTGVSITGWIPNLLTSGTILTWIGAAYCAVIVLIQLYSANRLYKFGQDKERAHNLAVRHLAEQMGDGYVRFSCEGKVLFASDVIQSLMGAQRYELMGQGLVERLHILDRPTFLKGLSDAVHSGKSEIIEARLRQDDPMSVGTNPCFVWVEVFFSPIADPQAAKENWQVVALFRDVTGRKDHEFELINARKKAEDASNIKSGFLATIGHELRTPLNAIVGFSEMMTNSIGGKLEPAHEEYAQLIHQSGHHLLDVVNMLLDMSKIEAGKFELQLTDFDAEELVQPCLQMISPNATEKGVKLVADLAQNLPPITGDERACRQILINLLSNAVKFSKEGGVVSVRVKRQGQKLSISVKDTGIGMSAEAASRVGEAFFQAHDGLSRQYEGTGLGLSIVKGLVELHEGTFKINSELGHGTTITVLLPVHGPQTKFVEPEIITPLVIKKSSTQPGSLPEQKRIAQ